MQEAGEMMKIDALHMNASALNELIRYSNEKQLTVTNVLGHRYIGDAAQAKQLTLYGTCGNNLGAFLAGAHITLYGNAQENVADTMDDGEIIIHGRCGDACGYGMRGGKLYIKDDCGSRCGVHMKAYHEKQPIIVIGGTAKDYLGEYLAGGMIIVLNLQNEAQCVGKYCASGAHGGAVYLRLSSKDQIGYTPNSMCEVTKAQQQQIDTVLSDYQKKLNIDLPQDMKFYRMEIDQKNPYEGLYTAY